MLQMNQSLGSTLPSTKNSWASQPPTPLNLRLSKQALIPSQSSGIKGILEISGVKPLIPKPQAVFFPDFIFHKP